LLAASFFVPAPAAALAACKGEQSANQTVAVDESAEIQAIQANDTTAIDAATNDAANMAEDVNLTVNLPDNASDTNAATANEASSNAQ
jgi:hypothetical protein